jgi:hypothetical protein
MLHRSWARGLRGRRRLSRSLLPRLPRALGPGRAYAQRIRPLNSDDRARHGRGGAVGGQDREEAAGWGAAALAILVLLIIPLFARSLGKRRGAAMANRSDGRRHDAEPCGDTPSQIGRVPFGVGVVLAVIHFRPDPVRPTPARVLEPGPLA